MWEILGGLLSFLRLFLSFYIFYFQDLSENHPGERVSWLKTIVINVVKLNSSIFPKGPKITGLFL